MTLAVSPTVTAPLLRSRQLPGNATSKSYKHPHLYRKGNIYYFRQVLPKTLRDQLGKTEIRLSLKTAYVREAGERVSHLSVLFTKLVEERPLLSYGEIKLLPCTA